MVRHQDFYTPAFCVEHLERELDALEKREKLLEPDVVASAFIRAHWGEIRLFDGTVHPTRAVWEHMATQALTMLGCDPTSWNRKRTTRLYRLGASTMPVYPSIVRGLGLTFADDRDRCVTAKGELSLRRLIREFLDLYATCDRSKLQALVEFQRPFVVERYATLEVTRRPTAAIRLRLSARTTSPTRAAQQTPARAPLPVARLLPVSEPEVQLLTAALVEDANTVAASWQRWRAVTDLDALPPDQFMLLPKLYSNLARCGLADSADPRIKGVYHRSWYRYQQIGAVSRAVLDTFQNANIPALLIGAAAINQDLYGNRGERPCDALDLLTLPAHIQTATTVLLASGWTPARAPDLLARASYQRWANATTFTRAGSLPLVLRWRILPEAPLAGFATRFLEIAPNWAVHPPRLKTETDLVLAGAMATQSATDKLVALADTVQALMLPRAIDWPLVHDLAHILQLAGPLATTLRTVAAIFNVSVDSASLDALDELGASEPPARRQNHGHSPGLSGTAESVQFHLHRWRRIARANGSTTTPATFLRYLQVTAGVSRLRHLPGYLWRRTFDLKPRPRGHTSDPHGPEP